MLRGAAALPLVKRALFAVLCVGAGCTGGSQSDSESPGEDAAARESSPSVEAFTAESGAEHSEGFVPLWVDVDAGAVYAELDVAEAGAPGGVELLLVEGLARGHGANPIGLDRGELGSVRLLRLRLVGARVVAEVVNTEFRAEAGDPDELRATAAAFPTAILASLPVVARDQPEPESKSDSKSDSGPRVLVDLEPLLVGDLHGVAASLSGRDEGRWRLAEDESFVEIGALRAFPDNVELEASLTFTSDEGRGWADSTSPESGRLSLRQHVSLVRLPPPGFEPRAAVEDLGTLITEHLDFSVPLDRPLAQQLALRHRLVAGEPLVYYVDRGTPEPIRSALIEGASWWAEAFAAAGFPDGFRVELLPEGVDPMDVRYNVINWVHRSTRGWSYGHAVHDPRTGEIIKGNVTLGSQRVRQDRRIFEALLGVEADPAKVGKGGGDPVSLALARIRQLAAHEVGHTLGFRHNFAASTYGRASVMDYPAPRIHLDGEPGSPDARYDLSQVYAEGIGEWDLLAFEYLYREWQPGEGEAAVAELRERAAAAGMVFLSDPESRPQGSAHPEGALWDNGSDSVAELREVLDVRAHALGRFGPYNLTQGAQPKDLERTLAPLYFFHRYQLEAAAKRVGGQRFELDPQLERGVRPVPWAEQREALDAVLGTLDPAVLDVPASVEAIMRPTPDAHIDALPSYAGPDFDALALARAAADMTLGELLDRRRVHRLELQASRSDAADALDLAELLDRIEAKVWPSRVPSSASARTRALFELTRAAFVDALMGLAGDPRASPRVTSVCEAKLSELLPRLERARDASAQALAGRVRRWLDRAPGDHRPAPRVVDPPPGSPIGTGLDWAQACSWKNWTDRAE